MFAQAVAKFKSGSSPPEPVKVYEKILPGVWSLTGYFDLIDYKIVHDGSRQVFRYILRLSDQADIGSSENQTISQAHTRLIPSEVKKEVWNTQSGHRTIFASIFAPGPYFGPDYGYGPDDYGYWYGGDYGDAGSPNIYYDSPRGGGGYSIAAREGNAAKTEQADREALAETNTAAVESCTGLAPGVTNLPIDQIRQTVHPTGDQEAVLDDLSAASTRASDVIKSSCPSSVPLTPIGRLDAAEQRLDATIKAIQVVRSPLERFYEALNDEQRQRFNAMNGSTRGAPSAGNMVAACSQGAGSFIDLPAQRIEQVVQPTAQQQSAFDDLKKAAQKAGDQLQSSCPTAVPKSPVARVDTVETRLTAMADAIKSVRPDLQNFYASLSDEQKAKFNTIGPPPKAASSPPQRQSGDQQ